MKLQLTKVTTPSESFDVDNFVEEKHSLFYHYFHTIGIRYLDVFWIRTLKLNDIKESSIKLKESTKLKKFHNVELKNKGWYRITKHTGIIGEYCIIS